MEQKYIGYQIFKNLSSQKVDALLNNNQISSELCKIKSWREEISKEYIYFEK